MIKITLKGGTVREYESGVFGWEVAASIGAGLAKSACAVEINGVPCDLRTPITEDCELSILFFVVLYGNLIRETVNMGDKPTWVERFPRPAGTEIKRIGIRSIQTTAST